MNLHTAAIHEAGHTVVALVLGRRVKRAVAFPDGTGNVRYEGRKRPFRNAVDAQILLAGTEAEDLARCSTDACEKDARQYDKVLANLAQTSEEQAKVDKRLRRETRKLLRKNWAAVKRIAEGLEERNFLHRAELWELYDQ